MLRCLDEPLHVADPAKDVGESTREDTEKQQTPAWELVSRRKEHPRSKERSGEMQVMYQRCAGIDVHLRFVVVCLSIIEAGQRRKEIRTFRNAHSGSVGFACLAIGRTV